MAFVQQEKDGLVYMSSDIIPAFNAFSTRWGGVSTGQFESLNLSVSRGDAPENVRENYRRFTALAGVGINDCVVTNQVHGSEVKVVDAGNRHEVLSDTPFKADGLVTCERNLPLICFTADCIPVLMCDAEAGVAAAVHCGWRSSAADILGNAVEIMTGLGAKPENIFAALGPALGRCCFESDRDVPDALEIYLSGDTEGLFDYRSDGKIMVDLRLANVRRLLQLGLDRRKIDVSEECTVCCHDKYFSHRYTKGNRGSLGAMIALR